MGKLGFGLVWLFIFAMAGYDSYFAWEYRAVLPAWEQNPLACWGVTRFGLPAVLAFKFLTLTFAGLLAVYCRGRRRLLEYPITLIIGGAHAMLLILYALGHQQPS